MPVKQDTLGATSIAQGNPQSTSNLLPNGGALLFLCTCSHCRATIKALEPLLSAQPKMRSQLIGLTSMNTADNLRFSQETHASFVFATDALNTIRERYNVSQCPRMICLSKSGRVKYDSGLESKPLSTPTLQKALQAVLSKEGEQP